VYVRTRTHTHTQTRVQPNLIWDSGSRTGRCRRAQIPGASWLDGPVGPVWAGGSPGAFSSGPSATAGGTPAYPSASCWLPASCKAGRGTRRFNSWTDQYGQLKDFYWLIYKAHVQHTTDNLLPTLNHRGPYLWSQSRTYLSTPGVLYRFGLRPKVYAWHVLIKRPVISPYGFVLLLA
jgi:hypothetical protein